MVWLWVWCFVGFAGPNNDTALVGAMGCVGKGLEAVYKLGVGFLGSLVASAGLSVVVGFMRKAHWDLLLQVWLYRLR